MIDRELEADVRGTLRDVADQAHARDGLAQRLIATAKLPPATVSAPGARRGWLYPLLAAAAVAAVAAGIAAGLTLTSPAHRPATDHPLSSAVHTLAPSPNNSPPSSGANRGSGEAPAACATRTSADGSSLTVCPAAAAIGDTVTITAHGYCGATLRDLTLLFEGPASYSGSGGGGAEIPVTGTAGGFRGTFRIPATYPGGATGAGVGEAAPVLPASTYAFTTLPAAGCTVPFTVTAPGAAATHLLRVPVASTTIELSVPRGWQLSRTQPHNCCETPPTTCLVRAGGDFGGNPDNCVLTVTVGPAGPRGLTPDVPYPYPTQSCGKWRTIAESDAPLQGRAAEYRKFTDGCTGVTSESWTTMSAPQVVFWHPITDASSSATVAAIADTAKLPVVTDPRRQFDEGYLVGMSRDGSGYQATIDRVVVAADGTIIDNNPATYTYPLGSTAAAVYAQFRRGRHPSVDTAVDGAYVQVSSDGDGYGLYFFPPHGLP